MPDKENIIYHLAEEDKMITGYHNLPIGKYQQIIARMQQLGDGVDAHVSLIAQLNDITEEEAYNMPLLKYQELSERASFMMEELPKPSKRIMDVYALGSFKLVPTKDVKKFTTAQYIDYQQMIKEDNKIVEILSCLLVPKGCTYADGYDLAEVQNAIAENLSVMEAYNLSAFFLRKLKSSINSSLISLGMSMLTLPRKERKPMLNLLRAIRSSFKNGDGLRM
jgi:hypothetical protein